MGSHSQSEGEAARMPSYVSVTTSSSEVCSKHDDLFYNSFCMSESDKDRMDREFYNPDHIALSGNYWPRYRHLSTLGLPMCPTCLDPTTITTFPVGTRDSTVTLSI